MYRLIVIIHFLFLSSCSTLYLGSRGISSSEETIDVLGDLEGNITRFEDFVQKSDILKRNENGILELNKKGKFVFLGDLMDRGAGSIRIMDQLISLKERFPDRVTLILGNRDINKLRIMSLMDSSLTKSVPDIVIPWHKEVIESTFNIKVPSHLSNDEYKQFVSGIDTPLIRFKSFLSGMNAPLAFEYRRTELKIMEPMKHIDDSTVFTSFLSDYLDDGRLHKYLKLGEIGKVIDGNLFVHGAVTSENFGYVPGFSKRESDPIVWIDKLNNFAKTEINDWFIDSRNGQKLIDYHAPKAGQIKNLNSVIYARYSDDSGNPIAPKRSLIKKLQNFGIYRVIVGHTPTGDFPVIVRKPNFEVILADSSFSSLNKASKVSIKGKSIYSETELSGGEKVIFKSHVESNLNPIGMKTTDGYRIIGKIEGTDKMMLLQVSGEGRKFITEYVEESAIRVADKGLVEIFEQRVNSTCRKVMRKFLLSNKL